MKSHRELLRDARDAKDEGVLWQVIKTQNSQVLLEATHNRHLTEEMAHYISKNKNTPPEGLGFLATDIRFKDSYKIKLALCKNPKTPHRITLGFLKYLGIFDMADLSRNKFIPTVLRQRVEVVLMDKVTALPAGVKTALSRRASERIVDAIMQKGDRRVIDACLESPRLTEERLYRLIIKEATKPLVIRAIAEHPKWSLRHPLKYALVRNFHTPMKDVERFISEMKAMDLKTLYSDPKLPTATRPFIFRELQRRGEDVELPEEVVYELEGDEDKKEDFSRHSGGELFGSEEKQESGWARAEDETAFADDEIFPEESAETEAGEEVCMELPETAEETVEDLDELADAAQVDYEDYEEPEEEPEESGVPEGVVEIEDAGELEGLEGSPEPEAEDEGSGEDDSEEEEPNTSS